jgi:hypothetical protein
MQGKAIKKEPQSRLVISIARSCKSAHLTFKIFLFLSRRRLIVGVGVGVVPSEERIPDLCMDIRHPAVPI